MNAHLVELPVEGLTYGHYTILVSNAQAFTKRTDVIVHASFWSTRLSISQRSKGDEQEAQFLDRGTGAPLPNVIAIHFLRNWQNGNDRFVGSELMNSDAEGMLRAPVNARGGEVIWSLTKDGDEFISEEHWIPGGGSRIGIPGPDLRTFL